jgi:hypothetical protein
MNITLSVNNNKDIYVLPVVPNGIEIESSQKNETFEGLNGDITLIGNTGLKEFSVSSFFPVDKKYNFVAQGSEKNGWKYVEFIENLKKNKTPVRVVMTNKQKYSVFNGLCSIEKFKYKTDNVGDIQYTLDLKEFTVL